MLEESTITTTHGAIHVIQAGKPTSPFVLLLIHGNSSSSKVWRHIFRSEYLTSRYQIIALDLPGHGQSSNAIEPEQTYTMRGYAECASEFLTQLQVTNVVILGWSLGGHIALELSSLLQQHQTPSPIHIHGIMLVGTPPASGPTQTAMGFSKTSKPPAVSFASQEFLTEAEATAFIHLATGRPTQPWQREAAIRTDGRARRIMFAAFVAGKGVDQVQVVEQSKETLYAVVNGAEEPLVNLDYLDKLTWGRLWKGRCIRMEGAGHAPFWEQPREFEQILREFWWTLIINRDGGVVVENVTWKELAQQIKNELKPIFEADAGDKSGFFPSTTQCTTGLIAKSPAWVDLPGDNPAAD
ncbi:hypothetical protein BP5796_03596 [Coleophoma crateriformis]|uniref:AB hydrolase-1 domain-containing protein n=1 Tax=Coleophoma crateriformis TaxID=565419 RepID=A0A3D8SNP1_9HELO|nr:hypothetical protein BP5796_03596 [Coleophoma crateriformis]